MGGASYLPQHWPWIWIRSASAGHDASLRPFEDGSTQKLSEACRRFLINPGKDRDLRKWAADGLSFLTLDADVKEKLVDDSIRFHLGAILPKKKINSFSRKAGLFYPCVNRKKRRIYSKK